MVYLKNFLFWKEVTENVKSVLLEGCDDGQRGEY